MCFPYVPVASLRCLLFDGHPTHPETMAIGTVPGP